MSVHLPTSDILHKLVHITVALSTFPQRVLKAHIVARNSTSRLAVAKYSMTVSALHPLIARQALGIVNI